MLIFFVSLFFALDFLIIRKYKSNMAKRGSRRPYNYDQLLRRYSMKFKKGDKVTWKSQAMGSETTKRGKIVKVLPPGVAAWEVSADLPNHISVSGGGMARNHESYIVFVPSPKGKRLPKMYWPRVSALSLDK